MANSILVNVFLLLLLLYLSLSLSLSLSLMLNFSCVNKFCLIVSHPSFMIFFFCSNWLSKMGVSMLYALSHPYILMQSMLQMNLGQPRLMTFSCKFNVWMLYNPFSCCFPLQPFLKVWSMHHASYSDSANAYWTRFFTSRPTSKHYVRIMSGYYLVSFMWLF